MTEKRKVPIKDIVNDIRSRMPDHELMKKYNLSAKGIQRAFQKLVQMRAISQAEIDARGQAAEDTIFFESMRGFPRHYLVVQIPIHVVGSDPPKVGKVRDITEEGLGITGVDAEVGETKTFAFYPDEFVSSPPFSFKAVCRWIERRGPKDSIAGFQLTEISQESLDNLRQMIQEFTFGDG